MMPEATDYFEFEPVVQDAIGLCLSGGGYRAMVFHLGAIWRLYDSGVLGKVKRISSVSGGSLTAARLGLVWNRLSFDPARIEQDFIPLFINPVRDLAGRTIDAWGIIDGILKPGSISSKIEASYREHLLGDATLQDLPDEPRFIFNATSVQSGALWRFSKPFMGDYHVGVVLNPTVSLAKAAAASSAFPPVLSPCTLKLNPADFVAGSGKDLQREPYTKEAVLSDGGVYDNMGLETVFKNYRTVLVSDAGMKMQPEEDPHSDWAQHALRVNDLIDNQVRSLRKRELMAAYQLPADAEGHRDGAYWGVGTRITDYPVAPMGPGLDKAVQPLASIKTRLAEMDDATQQKLINWGYAICDSAIRSHLTPAPAVPAALPYPAAGI